MRISDAVMEDPIMVGQQPLEEVNQFTHLGRNLASAQMLIMTSCVRS